MINELNAKFGKTQTFLNENKNGIDEKQIEKVSKEYEKMIEMFDKFKQISEEIGHLSVRENQDGAQEECKKLYEKVKKIQSEFEEIELGDQQKQLHLLSDVEFGSEDSYEFEKDKTFGLGDQNGQDIQFSGSGPDQNKQTDNTDYDHYLSSSSNETDYSNTVANRNQSCAKSRQFISADQQIRSDAQIGDSSSKNSGNVPNPPFIDLYTLFLLKVDMEKLKSNDKNEKESKNKNKKKERKANSIDYLTAVQNDLSQMHVQTMEKLAMVREEFCQKLNEMSGLELIRRFSIMFPLDKMIMIWPTVRKCRVSRKVADWVLLTNDTNIPIKDQQIIPYQDTEAVLLANSYMNLFNDNELFGSGTDVSQIYRTIQQSDKFLLAAIWLLNNFIEELYLFIETVLESEEFEIRNDAMNKFWSAWTVTLNTIGQMDNLAQRFCTLHKFTITCINLFWTNSTEQQREELWQMLRKKRWSEMTIISEYIPTKTTDPIFANNDQYSAEKCDELIEMLTNEPNNELIHSLTLYRLIRRLNPFKGIFSGAAQQIELAKDRLLTTLGSAKEFELLEKALPEQLHIEVLCPSHRESLYARVLLYRSGTEMAQKAEHRFAISLLLGYFKLRLAVKLSVGTTQATDTRMALGIMRSQVYSKIDDAEGLCWMMHLVKFVDGGGSFILPPEPLILDCIVNNAQVPQFKQIRERIRKWHYEFLSSVENGIPLVSVFTKRSVAGTVTRLKRLLGKKLFDKLYAKYPQICQYPGNVFEDDKILTSFYRNAILNANSFPEIERISAKLAADIIVFVRWFDAEPKGQYICEYWHKQREELKNLYDNVFDENFTDVYGIGSAIYIFELTSGVLKQFLITHRHCDQPQVLKVVWQKLVKQLETESERLYSAGGKEKQEQQRHNPVGTEVREWLNQLHANQLKQIFLNQEPMVKTNGEEHGKTEEKYDPIAEFATLMKKGLSSMMEARILLSDFVGIKEVSNILRIIGIESKFDDLNDALLGKENGTNTGESSKNNKKKKKKAKKSKKEQNGEKENGKDTKNTSEDKISQDKVSTLDDTNENVKGDKMYTKNREDQLSEDKESTKNWEDQLSEEKESTKNFYDTVSFAVSEKMPKNDAKGNCQTDKVSPYEKTDDNDDKAPTKNLEGKEKVDKTQNKEKENKINEEEMLLKFDNNDKTSTKINGDKMTQSKDKVATKKKQRMSSKTKHRDSDFDENFEKNYENKNWLKIGEKLYRNWLARTLLSNGEMANDWDKLGKDSQTQAITVIFAAENGNRKMKEGKRKSLLKYMEKWSKTQAQLQLDSNQFNIFLQNRFLMPGQKPAEWRAQIEHLQQINFHNNVDLTNRLEQILTTHGHGLLDKNKTQEINENFNKIRTVIKEWSKGQSDLLLSGSMMLNAFTTDSDVDTICVSPEHIQADQFFGTVPCHQKFDEKCRNDDSLFCRLCFHPEVHSLQRIRSNWVPLIRLKVINFDHEIDIVFASIPGEQQIDADHLRQQNILTKIEEMIGKLDNKIKQLKEEEDRNDQASLTNAKEQMLKSLRSLAGYHSNLKLLEMVKKNNNFHKLLLVLKLWAKSNYIYNNAMGFFNGTSLGVLAAKIVLLYPEATVPFLLERFFFTYSSWEWPLPVQIAEIRPNSSLNWNAWDEQKHLLSQYGSGGAYSNLMLPVITPGFPESNSTYLINWQTAKIIKNALDEAFKLFHSSKSGNEKLSMLFEQQIKFHEKYSQYFAITCVASDLNMFNEFCGFVVTRIRVQLTRLSDCTRDDVDFCHLVLLNGCPPYTVQKHTKISSKIFCKTWLVGVKKKNDTESKHGQVGGHLQQNDNKLKQELDEVIVNSYKSIVLRSGRRGGANLNLAEQKIQKHFARNNLFHGTDETDNQRDFVNLESKYVDKQIHSS
ncbi:hypothetical protein niasHT_010547 [Heterodera trifolii]|uniref:polynucleotide adenylyltransferase n=1 Tax=Heterodera trifolii TaxID=157864 RepID=A0ABD2L230_9BILA